MMAHYWFKAGLAALYALPIASSAARHPRERRCAGKTDEPDVSPRPTAAWPTGSGSQGGPDRPGRDRTGRGGEAVVALARSTAVTAQIVAATVWACRWPSTD